MIPAYLMFIDLGFSPAQARALADAGYVAVGWWRAEAWVPVRMEVQG